MREVITVRRLSFVSLFKIAFIGTYGFFVTFFAILFPIGLLRGKPLVEVGGEALPTLQAIGVLLLSLVLILPLLCFFNAVMIAAFEWVGLWAYSKIQPIRISYHRNTDNQIDHLGRPG